jgi:carbamoyl-phosphate synthase small subunit
MSNLPASRPARLCLADGAHFEGIGFGAEGNAVGEAVFTTGMTGYQEVLTDPSFCGQIVTMTSPQIGNTGINRDDDESVGAHAHLEGLVVREHCEQPSNWRSNETLEAYLRRHGIVALSEIDTRSLTRHIREHGAQNAALGSGSIEELVAMARAAPPMKGLDLVSRVTPKERYSWTESTGNWRARESTAPPPDTSRHVVVLDLGIKRNILRCLVDVGCRVTAVPAATSADDILALGLGHQLLALAAGARTFKLKFGHRGINQPVKDLESGRVEITTQNHGFAVDLESLAGKAQSTHVHLNDGTSEGLTMPETDAFSVQFHPEAAAGPHDALYLFRRFATRIDAART